MLHTLFHAAELIALVGGVIIVINAITSCLKGEQP